MNATMFEQLALQALALPPWPDPRFPPSPYYRFFRLLAANHQPNLSVELGLCGGGGSFHLAIGWPAGTVVGVDNCQPDPHQRENWLFLQQRCPNFILWFGDSVESAAPIARKYGKVDIIFFDTIHETDWTWREYRAWLPHLSDRAVLCFDDLNRAEMAEFWTRIPEPKLRLDQLHPGSTEGGFGIAWKSS